MKWYILSCCLTACVALTRADGADVASAEPIDFQSDIKPLLADRCFACHGPDNENRQADLRLDLEESAKAAVIVAGDSDNSELYRRISSEDPDMRMPPLDANVALTPAEIERIKRWIDEGAPWSRHWSLISPEKVEPPPVKQSDWSRNAIDHFVLQRLEAEGVAPSPPATPEQWIRRLSFDLTGLPPSLEQIDAFVANPSDEAYEALVDALLASEHFGERMASEWLDVARYSDSFGYQVDRDRYVWPWRDWVIRALNANLPFDQFVTWQLAGDLLPNATDEQILATTFNRLHPQKVEGGSIPEEFRVEYVSDRTQTFATAFLGLTMECARCHDHKYDPWTQREYYQLYAFFNNIDEAGLYSYFTPAIPTPTLLLADESTKQRQAELRGAIARQQQSLDTLRNERRAAFRHWMASEREPSGDAKDLVPGRIAYLDFEQPSSGPNHSVPGRVGQAIQLTGDDGIDTGVGNFQRWEPFSVALWMRTPDVKDRAVVFHRSRAWTDAGSRGYELLLDEGCLRASLIHFWPGNAISVRTPNPVPTNTWLHVVMTYDGSSDARGIRLYINGQPVVCEIVRNNLYKNITGGGGDTITIGERFRDRGFTGGEVDEFQVFARELTAVEVAQLCDTTSLTDLLSRPLEKLSDWQRESLYSYYLAHFDEAYREARQKLHELRQAHGELVENIREIMVMEELAVRRPTFVLKRGAYDAPGAVVEPDTPAALPPFPADAPRNRLGLARWLVDPHHPLTARVAVNRLWQICFGRGLVATPEDFGSQGQPPSHPELLDWLARDFVEHGWDVKRMLKLMVMSSTYRQSSAMRRDLAERDPENRWLGRAPSYRWPAEVLRDNVLSVSGLLVDRQGGPYVRPYEVALSFPPEEHDHGEGLYRRSLYTYWKRTSPAPVMTTFDASRREVCVMRRAQTSSPVQALVMLNGTQFVEAARVIAQELLRTYGDQTDSALDELFRRLTGRHPTEHELSVLQLTYAEQLAYYEQHPGSARQLLTVGEAPSDASLPLEAVAAMGVVVNAVMNYDEAVMKR